MRNGKGVSKPLTGKDSSLTQTKHAQGPNSSQIPFNIKNSQDKPASHPTSLLERQLEAEGTFALQFAGQGLACLEALASYAKEHPFVLEWIEAASNCLVEQAGTARARWSGFFDKGYDLLEWLDETKRPALEYQTSCAVSQALIFTTQIVHYQIQFKQGLSFLFAKDAISVLTGHSQGIMPALLVAESPKGHIEKARFVEYVRYMFWQGYHMATSYLGVETQSSVSDAEITPMAAISGLCKGKLGKLIEKINANIPPQEQMIISLFNTRTRQIVSGPRRTLSWLRESLEKLAEKEAQQKKAGQFAGSPTSFSWEYLPVSAAYHSEHMRAGLEPMLEHMMKDLAFSIESQDLFCDVLSPVDGSRLNESKNLTHQIIEMQFVRPVRWQQTVRCFADYPKLQYVLDLGPGDGVARLTYSALKGTGIDILALTTESDTRYLFEADAPSRPRPLTYKDFAPTLRYSEENGGVIVENRYTRATGHSPVILPGMTPTTADVPIVAAAANQGFTAELAGGGQVTEEMFWQRMKELRESLEPGREIVFNTMYLDPYLWGLHIKKSALVQKARKAGYPICGVTISAGLPEVDEAVKWLDEFKSLGMWLNAFKPGTVAQVKHVVKIAKAAPHHTIFVHLEGGKAGGHHSWEDLDQLLLDAYHTLRSTPNIILCVGGGIGSEERASELLTGTWSAKFGLLPMPVDAVFLGTLAMATKEACTSPQVKEALAQAAGTDDWVFTGKIKGGVTSGKSQLNADIHYTDNPASRCGRLLDQVAGDAEKVESKKQELIEALNQTAKPFFGELDEMTYQQVLQRMIELMAVGRNTPYEDGIWPDKSFRARVADFIQRAEARLNQKEEGSFKSILADSKALDEPHVVLTTFVEAYPNATNTLVHPLDKKHFIHKICARPGKPVNFIPVIDADVRRWYKADSLWQSHDPRYAADQVLIIPGPEAVKGIHEADEPVASLLGRFEVAFCKTLQAQQEATPQGKHISNVPTTTATPQLNQAQELPKGFQIEAVAGNTLTLSVEETQPTTALYECIAESFNGPLAELFITHRIYEGKQATPNPVFALCQTNESARFTFTWANEKVLSKVLYKPSAEADESVALSFHQEKSNASSIQLEITPPAVEQKDASPYTIDLQVQENGSEQVKRGTFFSIEEGATARALRDFYHATLFGKSLEATPCFQEASATVSLEAHRSRAYRAITGGDPTVSKRLPVNMAFSMVWEPLFSLLSSEELSGGLLHLVHQENTIEQLEGWPIFAKETLQVTARITQLTNQERGRVVATECLLSREGEACAKVRSKFFIRGYFANEAILTESKEALQTDIYLADSASIDFLKGHDWLTFEKDAELQAGDTLTIQAEQQERIQRDGHSSFGAKGVLSKAGKTIAHIDLDTNETYQTHPLQVLAELLQKAPGKQQGHEATLAQTLSYAPQEVQTFAEVSGDLNPIHRSHLIARLGELDEPIVHGMWTAARLENFLLEEVAENKVERLDHVKAEFLAPILPGQALELKATRRSVEQGHMLVEATASIHHDGMKIPAVRLQARVKSPLTAYIFPGQGIQQEGMGMQGYARSKAAKQIWDRADQYTIEELGFSILQLVRNNPKELLIHGTPHRHPKGVLHLTQFTQVAMAVLAQAQVVELREAGVLTEDAVTCGHSLGEYNALSAITQVLPLETVIELVYQRGMVMHSLVARDEEGESGYRMVVIRPHYAGLNHAGAEKLIAEIQEQTGEFIQIVNYNVRGRQYSVTGKISALKALQIALDARTKAGGKTPYIEVPGIDVPFHSSVLANGVENFRQTLTKRLPQRIHFEQLMGRYIPNLVPKPFNLGKEYIQEVAEETDSHILKELLKDFDKTSENQAELARKLLIELLAWQFASPVRWIETQELLFKPEVLGGLGVEKIVEVGVGYQPTLANMARYSQKLMSPVGMDVSILNAEAEQEIVFYKDDTKEFEDIDLTPVQATQEEPQATEVQEKATPAAPQQAEQVQVVVAAPVAASAGPVEDQPVTAGDALTFLLAVQGKIKPEQLRADDTIDEVFDGVSSRRNQLLLDLGAEFQLGPIDGAHEKAIQALVQELEQRTGNYKAPGKYMQACQSEAIKRTFGRAGLGRKDLMSYLESQYGLGEGLSNAVLNSVVYETRGGDSNRGGQLGQCPDAAPGNKGDAYNLLEQLVALTGARKGISIAKQSGGSQGGGDIVDSAVVQALEDKVLGVKGIFMQQAKDLAAQLGHNFDEGHPGLPSEREEDHKLALLEAEYGAEITKLIAPRFSMQKHVAFTSIWAFAQKDLAKLYFELSNQRMTFEEGRLEALRLSRHNTLARVQNTARWYQTQAEKYGRTEIADIFGLIVDGSPEGLPVLTPTRPSLTIRKDGSMEYREQVSGQGAEGVSNFIDSLWPTEQKAFVKTDQEGGHTGTWNTEFQALLHKGAKQTMDFSGQTVLITGASPNSIAVACARHYLRGGARVIVTTTTYTPERLLFYRRLYQQEASLKAELHVLPFNQASFQDVESLVDWLFSEITEQAGSTVRVLKRPFAPNVVLPFGAIKDLATLDDLGTRSNAVIRAMLLSVERLLTGIAKRYTQQGLPKEPCHFVLPLSPNHGSFGGDGLYAETKAALEVLVNKWHSEYQAWGKAVSLCAARIGWVRGTGLMDANNPVAARLEESTGILTFSNEEMGFMLSALSTKEAREKASEAPLWADLTGGFAQLENLQETVDNIRQSIERITLQTRRQADLFKQESERLYRRKQALPQEILALPGWQCTPGSWEVSQQVEEATDLTGQMEDQLIEWNHWTVGDEQAFDDAKEQLLHDTIVIVGTGEMGPYGRAETRFEMEVDGELSAAGVLELAWMTGLIHFEKDGKGGQWVDTESGEEVPETEIAQKYRKAATERVGIRFVEEETLGFNPSALPVLVPVYLEKDFTFPVSSEEEARSFLQTHPEQTKVHFDTHSESWMVTRMAGTQIRVPRQMRLNRQVAGMLPKGLDLTKFGLTQDMLDQIDRITLCNLVATVDAFLSAGLSPQELMSWIHPTRVANTQGAGIGGMRSLHRLYLDQVLDRERQNDILQETLINVVAAHVVQSYVGSYGAMSHPVGACATAALSLEEGMDKILVGKADFVVAGGFDDMGREGMIGFHDMNATANTDEMLAMGIEPLQMARANDIRRRGFIEAQGGGTVLLARGDVAVKMGLPVQGILAYASSFSDGLHKSIPAPGMGALASAIGGKRSPLARSLKRYGLTTDDIALVYKHDTSTSANDPNENQLHHRIQRALGRTEGNPLFVVSQKTLTGHPKGGASAWQTVGLCQSLSQGIISGNRNLECVDDAMRSYTHMAFTDESLRPGEACPMKAGLLTSLGFGHVSGIALLLHPELFEQLIPESQREAYLEKAQARLSKKERMWAQIRLGESSAYTKQNARRFQFADGTPEQADEEANLLLNPDARLHIQKDVYFVKKSLS
mgnify:CR=1 FL=1